MKTSRLYQIDGVENLLSRLLTEQHVAAIWCTGAGKTLLSMMIATYTMGVGWTPGRPRFTHIIVLAPTNTLRDTFTQEEFSVGGIKMVSPPVERLDTNGLFRYLQRKQPEFVARVTHGLIANPQTLEELRNCVARDPQFARGLLWIFDEAHHAGERQALTEARALVLKAGGSVLSLTATPDRSDETVAIPADVYRIRRTLCENMADGYAPERICTEILHIDGEASEENGMVCVPVRNVTGDILRHLQQDELPKAIIRVKSHGDRQQHIVTLEGLVRAFQAVEQRVYIATDHVQDSEVLRAANQAILTAVREAKTRASGLKPDGEPYKKNEGDLPEILEYENSLEDITMSCLDQIIGMQTVLEGLDWAACSHLYLVGVPSTIPSLAQGVGRTIRSKTHFRGCGRWQQISKIVLLAAGDPKRISRAHVNQTIRIACYLANFQQWTVFGRLAEAFRALQIDAPTLDAPTPEEREALVRIYCPPEWEPKAAAIRQAIGEEKLVFARVSTRMKGSFSPTERAQSIMFYIEKRLEQGRLEDPVLFASITQEDIRNVIVFDDPAKGRTFAGDVAQMVKEGKPCLDAVRAILDRYASDPDPMLPTVMDQVLSSFTLTADSMETMATAAEAGAVSTRRHQPGSIAAAVEGLRR